MDKHDELIVPNAGARFLGCADIADAGLADHAFVVFLVFLRLVADVDVNASICGSLEGLADRKVTKFVEHGAQLVFFWVPLLARKANEAGESLKQPAREPHHW